jgi:predicted NAD/FAD-binding protein
MCRNFGVSQEWWDIVFTPHYTASFLTDKLDNMSAVTGPLIEPSIPLNPASSNAENARLTTCETWADAGVGIREAFAKMTEGVTVLEDTRVLKVHITDGGQKRVLDEHNGCADFDRVVFACPCNAVGNIHEGHNWYEDSLLATPEYADDHHPGDGHMHAYMHSDASIIDEKYREKFLAHGSNYVEITQDPESGRLNIENTYNFGVQTPEMVVKPLEEKPPMLISHTLPEGKEINPDKILGSGNHVRAHPLYSGWNIMTMLSMKLVQGRNGIYYCSNWTTPGNCHDMSLLSGISCAHAIGADYPFEGMNPQATKDFKRLYDLMMGISPKVRE